MDINLKDSRWLLIVAICAFGAAFVLFVVSIVVLCKVCCGKKKKGEKNASKDELDKFLGKDFLLFVIWRIKSRGHVKQKSGFSDPPPPVCPV